MKKLFVSVLMLISVASFAQTVDEVIAKHIAARGGAEKLNALKSVKMEANMSVAGMEVPVKIAVVPGTGMRMDVTAMGSDIITVVDTTGGWIVNPMNGISEPQKVAIGDVKSEIIQMDLSNGLLNYKASGSTVELLGKEAVKGADAFKVKLTLKNGSVITHYIDVTNFNLVKTARMANVAGQEFEGNFTYSNHKAVDGIVFPFSYEVEHPQFGAMATTFTKIEVNPTIDAAIFAIQKK